MGWTLLIIGLVLVAIFVLKKLALIPVPEARALLRGGALIVDVRSPEEFSQGHVPGAVNIPLDELPQGVMRRVPDKHQALLLHCRGGGRSGLAQRLLQKQGYARVFNVGSMGRAERIVGGR